MFSRARVLKDSGYFGGLGKLGREVANPYSGHLPRVLLCFYLHTGFDLRRGRFVTFVGREVVLFGALGVERPL